MNTTARRCIRDCPVGSVSLDSVSLMLYLIDVYDLMLYVCCALLICYHELFRYLDYYLIMIFVWEAWPRLLILIILLICYVIDVLSLVMTA